MVDLVELEAVALGGRVTSIWINSSKISKVTLQVHGIEITLDNEFSFIADCTIQQLRRIIARYKNDPPQYSKRRYLFEPGETVKLKKPRVITEFMKERHIGNETNAVVAGNSDDGRVIVYWNDRHEEQEKFFEEDLEVVG